MTKHAIRIANFMDSSLEALDTKGNLLSAPSLYNPKKCAEKVIHFTPYPSDKKYNNVFSKWKIDIFPYCNRKSNIYNPKLHIGALFYTLKKIRNERLNIIRGRLPYYGSFIGCMAGKLLRIPSVVSLGGNNRIGQERSGKYYYGSKMISYSLEHIVLRLADKIIVPNIYTKKYVASIIGSKRTKKKAVIIPWALSNERKLSNQKVNIFEYFNLDPIAPIVLVVGFINKYKYSDIIFKVIEKINASFDIKPQFVFCGDGPLRTQGETLFKGNNNVFFIGWRQHIVVQALINYANIVLVPMSGYVLLEAAEIGKPVIASNVEWHGEIIMDGKNGFLVNPTAVEEWAAKIKLLLNNKFLAKEIGTKLRREFYRRYNPNKLVKKEIFLYHTLLNG